MTQDEIIAMAKQVGFPIQHPDWQKAVEEFAALIEAKSAAKEREACAKVCEKYAAANTSWTKAAVKDCAAAIRARGEA
jgi:hypothetical protein